MIPVDVYFRTRQGWKYEWIKNTEQFLIPLSKRCSVSQNCDMFFKTENEYIRAERTLNKIIAINS